MSFRLCHLRGFKWSLFCHYPENLGSGKQMMSQVSHAILKKSEDNTFQVFYRSTCMYIMVYLLTMSFEMPRKKQQKNTTYLCIQGE